jgi:hypothetical protein
VPGQLTEREGAAWPAASLGCEAAVQRLRRSYGAPQCPAEVVGAGVVVEGRGTAASTSWRMMQRIKSGNSSLLPAPSWPYQRRYVPDMQAIVPDDDGRCRPVPSRPSEHGASTEPLRSRPLTRKWTAAWRPESAWMLGTICDPCWWCPKCTWKHRPRRSRRGSATAGPVVYLRQRSHMGSRRGGGLCSLR